ncbi:hypothetical protein AYI69_g1716 [Smittium culicis]|uniref:Reverse transcriptase domain-containing protein n=1 Tax=Smittium culicis TaxID=133412 RepID=A0A1R1YPM9_9FUNG|nr:hypothetical protein AYI69_g1716 [Smittium culicis]
MSPLLFNIYIDDLAVQLAKTSKVSHIPAALFFADDVQLLPRNRYHAIEMISIVEKWSLINGMSANVNKCGIVTSDIVYPLSINNKLINVVPEYKYLGLPTTCNGINWHKYTSDIAHKAINNLNYLRFIGSKFHPLVRLSLYKTFIKPILEYAAPLVYVSCKEKPSLKKCYIKPLQKVQSRALGWISYSSNHTATIYTRLLQSICGLEGIEDRFKSLLIRFGLHFENLCPTNPAKILAESHHFDDKISLLGSNVHNHSSYTEAISNYKPCDKDDLTSSITKKKKYLNRKLNKIKYANIIKTKTINDRIKEILPVSRHPENFTDISIRLKNPLDAKKAIRYRIGSLCPARKCPVCKNKFRHTHIQRCLKLSNTEQLFTNATTNKLIIRLNLIIAKVKKLHDPP